METLHNGRYCAEYGNCADGPILVITRPRGGGKHLIGDAAIEWAEHIRTALDKSEANALCRAILEA